MFSAPRETAELMPFEITLDGTVQTVNVSYSIVTESQNARPTTWTAAEVADGRTHARISGMTPGFYRLFVRVSAGTETPVVDCGLFQIS